MIGLAKRKMKPLDGWYIYSRCLIPYSFQHRAADLFYLWKQEHITFTKGWLSTYLHFASEVKNSCDLNCWNKGKKCRNTVISLTAESQPQKLGKDGGIWGSWAQYLGCRVCQRILANSHSVLTRGDRDRCCAHTEGMAGCSGVHGSQGDKLKTEQNKPSQICRRFLTAKSFRILSLS